ncbi:MAG: hypothetical protein FWC79_07650 [Oscillospiraceae bacterium]|nr:hypothetical protein [Oscillospiraceae bacterium]
MEKRANFLEGLKVDPAGLNSNKKNNWNASSSTSGNNGNGGSGGFGDQGLPDMMDSVGDR